MKVRGAVRRPLRVRPRVFLALGLAAVVAGCGSTPTLPGGVPNAQISVAVDPNPVPVQLSATLGFANISYKVVVKETAGLGGEFVFVNATVFDETSGQSVGVNNFDAADLIVFVGSKRLEGGEDVEISQQIDFPLVQGSAGARLAVSVRFRDDRGRVLNQALLVKVV